MKFRGVVLFVQGGRCTAGCGSAEPTPGQEGEPQTSCRWEPSKFQLVQLQRPPILLETSFKCQVKQLAMPSACVIMIIFLISRPAQPFNKTSGFFSPPLSSFGSEALKHIENSVPSHRVLREKHRITVFALFIMFPQLSWLFDQDDHKHSMLLQQICSCRHTKAAQDQEILWMEMWEKWAGEVWRDQLNSHSSIPQKFKQKITHSSSSEILPWRWWYGLSNYCDYREPERNYPVPIQGCYL